jgi:hypothetical protein
VLKDIGNFSAFVIGVPRVVCHLLFLALSGATILEGLPPALLGLAEI